MISLIVENKPKSPSAEAYRTLRTNIEFSSLDSSIKTILVTSANPEEGKSSTAGNLAITISQTGKKVLLIDCDMRRPSLHKMFNISTRLGLTNLLIEDLELKDVAVKVSDNLEILPCGTIPPNPSEILSSKKMNNLLTEAKEKYDNIILDSPPIVAVTDAQILSTKANGVLLTVSSGKTSIESSRKAKDLLQAVNANILGVVLNRVDIEAGKGYDYYYGKKDRKSRRNK